MCHYGGEVGGNKGFARFRSRTGNHEDIVARIQHGEVYVGTQGADGFDGDVGGVIVCQQIIGAAGQGFEFAFQQVAFLLGFGVGYEGGDFEIEVFNLFRRRDASAHTALQHDPHGGERACGKRA